MSRIVATKQNIKKSFEIIISEYLDTEFDFNLDSKRIEGMNSINDLSVIRNILTHNHGKIDRQFMTDISNDAPHKLDQTLIIVPEYIMTISKSIVKFIRDYDHSIFDLINSAENTN